MNCERSELNAQNSKAEYSAAKKNGVAVLIPAGSTQPFAGLLQSFQGFADVLIFMAEIDVIDAEE